MNDLAHQQQISKAARYSVAGCDRAFDGDTQPTAPQILNERSFGRTTLRKISEFHNGTNRPPSILSPLGSGGLTTGKSS
jgi:hypothetical protein